MAAKNLIFTILGIDRASPAFKGVGDAMDTMGNRAMATLLGVSAASATSAAAIAGAVAAVPLAFAGLGAVALRENTAVRQAFDDLGEHLRTGLAADAAPLEATFVGVADKIGDAYTELSPQIAHAFAASTPHINTMTDAAVSFARQAMPGLVTAVVKAGPVMEGFRVLARDSGAGISEFLDVISEGAPQAGQGIEHLGQLARDGLPELGGILVHLTGLWATHGDEVVGVVTRILGVVGDLSGSALPITSAALGVMLDVLSGVLSVIEPMTGAIGPLIGAWLALSTAIRTITAVKGAVDSVSTSFSNFQTNVTKAAGQQGVGKFATGVGAVTSALGGPWGAAIGLGIAVLGMFGQKSRDAASDQRSLSAALRDSGGSFDDNARRALVNSEGYKAIADTVGKAGLSHSEYINAITQGGPALDALKARLEAQKRAGEDTATESGELVVSYTDQAAASDELLRATDGLRGTVQGAVGDFEREKSAVDGAANAARNAMPGADELREALKKLGDETATTAEHADALNTAWRQLFGKELNLEEATAQFEEDLDNVTAAVDRAKKGTSDWKTALFDASGQLNLTTEQGRGLHEALLQQGESYRELAQTAYDTALRQSGSHEFATEAARKATESRRAQFIAEWKQMGFNTEQAERLANMYFGFPDDVMTLIQAKDEATDEVSRIIRDNSGRVIGLTVRTSGGRTGYMIGGPNIAEYADGGLIRRYPTGGMVRGPGGPRSDAVLAAVSNGEFVVNARSTARNRALLEAINNGAVAVPPGAAPPGPSAMAGVGGLGSTTKNYNLTAYVTNTEMDLRTQFRRMELLDGG